MTPRMIVEWGEVEAGLNAIHGALEGVAGSRTLADISPRLRDRAITEFGRRADVASTSRGSQDISHTYEWGKRGLVEGRLWYPVLTGGGQSSSISFDFHDSTIRVPLGGTDATDREQRAAAEAAGARRAVHIWKRKASDLEYNTSWVVEAGNPSPETLAEPGSSAPSKSLIIYRRTGGTPMFRRRWRNYSPYTNNFTNFFNGYWDHIAPDLIEQDLADNFERKVAPQVHKIIEQESRGKGMIRPATMSAPGPITMVSQGKPIIPGTFATKPSRRAANAIRKRMKEAFRRIR